jgi:hypothetical protein
VALKQQYQQLSTDYKHLRQIIMEIKSQMASTCAPFFWAYGPWNDQSLPAPPLF